MEVILANFVADLAQHFGISISMKKFA